ncbi:FAD-dependent oxidoreductase [Ruminococcus gauvreauii]|uniref:FAD-dependent oxidoreductase n=1 Tax=Ruminococcus gauvreauii TaxID=438033 RepID=A0ABY5VHD5_9FIRM|nr:FAD-dependent oxidoreductase [Ruminococcus gauvreauii]UWP59636.1 FAD-dependent oxidoreductase [Ruminococcus gauvreauii]
MRKFDAIIIGFGKGGKTLAGALAAAGRSVAVIEQSAQMYGGTCINAACIPTKSLVHSAARSAVQGGSFDEKSDRYTQAVETKDRLTSMLRDKNYHKLADNPDITVIDGHGSFTGPHSIAVSKENQTEELEAEQIFINTGARPFVPTIPGLSDSDYVYLSEDLLDLKTLPRRLAIIGGGYIGMEFASMFANFGSQVTVIQDGDVFLPREDAEIAQAVMESLENRGVMIMRSAKTELVQDTDCGAMITISTGSQRQSLHADAILVATGRRPNVEGLNLKAAGIELTARGAVKTDDHLHTTAPNIWAMGDVAGGLQFTYISLDDYRIVKSQILGDGSRTVSNRGAVPYSVFLDPPFSRVGMTETEAREKGYDIQIAKLPASAIPKAQVLEKADGLLKAVIDRTTGRILGAHLFCEESYEMINIIKLAIDSDIPYTVLRDNIYTHPTMSEALNDLFDI